MNRVRVIPTLLIDKGDLVKTIRFKNKQYIGDPINAIKIFNEKEVDELVLLDISATQNNTPPNYSLIESIASECFMPLSYGGGISDIEQVKKLFKSGVEKIVLNSACFNNTKLIQEISSTYGKQSVCISIDVKKDIWGNFKVYRNNGKTNTHLNPIHFALKMEELGAGELILNSIDKDGTYEGYEYELIRLLSKTVKIPVIALGGAGKIEDLNKALEYGASAVAAGSLFSFYGKLKAVLINYPTQEELKEKVYNFNRTKNKELNILHITPWYPTKYDTKKALFIKENFDAINNFSKNYLLHFEISIKNRKKEESYQLSTEEETICINSPFKIWFLIEIIALFSLLKKLKSINVKENFDLINFHIAYPLGVYVNLIQKIYNKPIVISEHWTAYHFNFYSPTNRYGLSRIKNIFNHKIPVITVSEALAEDIKQFSQKKEIPFYTLFNIVDTSIFNCKNDCFPIEPTFFMLNMWSAIKQPFIGIDAFIEVLKLFPTAKLKIGGFGPLWDEIEEYIKDKKLENSVKLLGKLSKQEIAYELNSTTALLHTSKYETFSVISAEAICCGVPVIALNSGGIPSFINDQNGFLHSDDSLFGWKEAMLETINKSKKLNRTEIAKTSANKFDKIIIGQKYYSILTDEFRKYHYYRS
jgi:cyclase